MFKTSFQLKAQTLTEFTISISSVPAGDIHIILCPHGHDSFSVCASSILFAECLLIRNLPGSLWKVAIAYKQPGKAPCQILCLLPGEKSPMFSHHNVALFPPICKYSISILATAQFHMLYICQQHDCWICLL